MKNLADIQARLKIELDQWFIKQCRNNFEDYYLYYLESKPEHEGGIIIAADPPANSEYQLAGGGPINKGATVEQNFNALQPIINRLPILSYR